MLTLWIFLDIFSMKTANFDERFCPARPHIYPENSPKVVPTAPTVATANGGITYEKLTITIKLGAGRNTEKFDKKHRQKIPP